MRTQLCLITLLFSSVCGATAEALPQSPHLQLAASCPAVSSVPPGAGPAAQNRQTSCLEGAYCSTVQDCAALCSGFATTSCVDNECHYTYGSPGGGSGGGGTGGSPYCLATPCQSFQDCVCLRPDGIYDFGQCIQNSCLY